MSEQIYLHLGASRLEFLPDSVLRYFLSKRWIHFGDAKDGSCSWARRMIRKWRLIRRRNRHDINNLYENTNFVPWLYSKGDRLPFEDGQLTMVFSEHFFEHLFFDEALSLMRECSRILRKGGVLRVVVPDADLRTYALPEPIGYPNKKLSFNSPHKHKTRWSVYMLSETLVISGFTAVPIHYCDRDGKFNRESVGTGTFDDQMIQTLEYVRCPMSLIVDGINRLLKKSPVDARQGGKWRKSAVYMGVNEHFEPLSNAAWRRPRLFQQPVNGIDAVLRTSLFESV